MFHTQAEYKIIRLMKASPNGYSDKPPFFTPKIDQNALESMQLPVYIWPEVSQNYLKNVR